MLGSLEQTTGQGKCSSHRILVTLSVWQEINLKYLICVTTTSLETIFFIPWPKFRIY